MSRIIRKGPAAAVGLALTVLAAAPAAQAAAPASPSIPMAGDPAVLPLAAAVDTALENNAALAAARARARAAAAVSPQAGALPDPRLQLNAANLPVDSFATGEEPMTQLQLGISQDLPFPGKRALRREAAHGVAEATRWESDETALVLVRDVKKTWWELFFMDRALEAVTRNQALLRQLVSIAQTKYKVGQGLQQDVLLAQLELSRLLEKGLRYKALREQGEARLNALLNRRADTPVTLPSDVDPSLPPPPTLAALEAAMLEARPLLQGRDNRVEAARKRLELARKDRMPDFRVGVVYGQRDGWTDMATLQFSMTLPLYAGSKQDKAVDQRAGELLQAGYARDDAQSRAAAEIVTALARYRQSREQTELFQTGIVPQARQTVESMRAGYQVNKVDFLNLVRAQTILYDYETQYWQSLSAARQAMADLEAAVGRENIHE